MVYYQGQDLLAYVDLKPGPNGIWAQPFIHPDFEDVPARLACLLQNLPNRRERPVYLCVRSYQSWLEASMDALGAQPGQRQAVMVKRLTLGATCDATGSFAGAGGQAGRADPADRPISKNMVYEKMTQLRITDNLDAMLNVLPPPVVHKLVEMNRSDDLLEVILDLGRVPTARYVDDEYVLSEIEVTHSDLEYVVERIGEFDADNRAGLERTLHRISAIRNRRGHIVGLTCRVGRAVYGTTDIIQDLIESGKSLLLLGRPGVGKTTMLREAARLLAESKRVVIVDTSNEIGGDGDVAHPAVGRARRMQVSTPLLQHEVMIEAVENHNPEVIVIDEIGRELEAAAARTIAERGVQLIGTAHGNTLENLLLNPTLSDLVGGIESVTLSDEEARRRGTQKTVLERRAPPTFDMLIEIQERDRVAVHADVAEAVDASAAGIPAPAGNPLSRSKG